MRFGHGRRARNAHGGASACDHRTHHPVRAPDMLNAVRRAVRVEAGRRRATCAMMHRRTTKSHHVVKQGSVEAAIVAVVAYGQTGRRERIGERVCTGARRERGRTREHRALLGAKACKRPRGRVESKGRLGAAVPGSLGNELSTQRRVTVGLMGSRRRKREMRPKAVQFVRERQSARQAQRI